MSIVGYYIGGGSEHCKWTVFHALFKRFSEIVKLELFLSLHLGCQSLEK